MDDVKEDLHDRKENLKGTLGELKDRISLKKAGTPILFSDDTVLGKHFKRAREITAKTLGKR